MATAFRQATTAANTTGSSNTTSAFASQPLAASVVAVWVGWQNDLGETLSSVTDSAGNTYTIVDTWAETTNNQTKLALAYAKNVSTTASFTVTATMSASVGSLSVVAQELTGCDTTAPLGIVNATSSFGTAATATSGNIGTPAQDGHIIVAAVKFLTFPDAVAAGSGYTLGGAITGLAAHAAEYQVQTTAAAVTATFGVTGAGDLWLCAAATFKPTAGGGTLGFEDTGPLLMAAGPFAGGWEVTFA